MASPPHPVDGPWPVTTAESRAVFHAERDGFPFLVYRDLDGEQQLLRLPPERAMLSIGRNSLPGISSCSAAQSWGGKNMSVEIGMTKVLALIRPKAALRSPSVRRATSPRCHFQAMQRRLFGSMGRK